MLNKMQGFADSEELLSFYRDLSLDKSRRSKENKFCLFVKGIGFLDGEKAYIYLNEKFGDWLWTTDKWITY